MAQGVEGDDTSAIVEAPVVNDSESHSDAASLVDGDAEIVNFLPPEQAVEALVSILIALGIGGLINAPIAMTITSFVKRVPQLQYGTSVGTDNTKLNTAMSSKTINTVAGVIIVIIASVATRYGRGAEFKDAMDIMVIAAPIIVMLVATIGGSTRWYETAMRNGIQILGSSRHKTEIMLAEGAEREVVHG